MSSTEHIGAPSHQFNRWFLVTSSDARHGNESRRHSSTDGSTGSTSTGDWASSCRPGRAANSGTRWSGSLRGSRCHRSQRSRPEHRSGCVRPPLGLLPVDLRRCSPGRWHQNGATRDERLPRRSTSSWSPWLWSGSLVVANILNLGILVPVWMVAWFVLTIAGGLRAAQGQEWTNPVMRVVRWNALDPGGR